MIPKIQTIRNKKDADRILFEPGFKRLTGVSFVTSLRILREYFTTHSMEDIEIVVGRNFSEEFREELSDLDIEVAESITDLCVAGKLRLLIPRGKENHSKLYILERDDFVRVVIGSANLTETGTRGRQTNLVFYYDLAPDHPFVQEIQQAYEKEHKKNCDSFTGSMVEELKKRQEQGLSKREALELWLNQSNEDNDAQLIILQGDIREQLLSPQIEAVPVIVQVPKSERTEKAVLRLFENLNPARTGDHIEMNRLKLIKFIQETWHGTTLMDVSRERKAVRLNVTGDSEELTEPLPDPVSVNAALAHLEEYINTVDLGTTKDPLLAKQSMFEALLYFFSAPFAHEYMTVRRQRQGISKRGPLVLYITGHSANGKSTFLNFAMKLISGHNIQPIDGQTFFTKSKIRSMRRWQTAFPLVFDDALGTDKKLENILKPYWETEWKEGIVSPQLILSSNFEGLRDWAKTRVMRIVFDVHYVDTSENRNTLSRLLATENRVFRWFSHVYLQKMESEDILHDDQLHLARVSLRELYHHAGRELPPFFLDRPIEELYDVGKREWLRLIRMGKITLTENSEEVLIEFPEGMEHREISQYEGHIPQTAKRRRTGKIVSVENPAALFEWIPREKWPMGTPANKISSIPPEAPKPSFVKRLFHRHASPPLDKRR